jgi:DNA mismatch repair protein MutS2
MKCLPWSNIPITISMNEKTLKLLEYDEILRRVSSCALSSEAAALILADSPKTGSAEAAKQNGLVSAILELMDSGSGGEVREELPETGGLLKKLDVEGTSLEIEEAYALGIFLSRGETLKAWLAKGTANGSGGLAALLEKIPDCSAVSGAVFKVIDKDGSLRDLPEFKEIRRRIQSLTKDLENAGARYISTEENRRMLQSVSPSLRDGRMVLAVKAKFRGRIKGIVHEVSSTGQTVFIEPEEVVEKNNELLIEQRRLEAVIRRVLRELTARIAERREDLAAFRSGVLYLETLRAKARYGLETRARFAAEDPSGAFVLKNARHPLLGSKAVPLDFAMSGAVRSVIITGPNTGGKTVALKTAGLLALMNQSAVPIPADEGSFLPVFDGIYADIGDEQSISQSLSTFSAHMTNMASIISRAGENSLVLLDELGSGTDPEEGSAIAMAILDCFIGKKTRLIVTTHHGILKNYGYTRDGVENASMEFNGRTLSPTFRVIMGIPGESRAMDIAERNGLPRELVALARSYLADEQADISALIKGLREKHRELDEAVRAGRVESERLREERRKADLKELRLRQKELHLKTEGAGNLRRLLAESRKQFENLVREIKEGELTREKILNVKEFFSHLEESVNKENRELEKEEAALVEERRLLEGESGKEFGQDKNPCFLEPGADVLAGETKRRGRILRASKKGHWVVEIGALKMDFPASELIPVPPLAEEKKPLIHKADLITGAAALREINLRGMRLDEALLTLRRQIDTAVLSGLHEFSVVHGKGDGILQKGVHDYLSKENAVASYCFSRSELGGFGRTEVILK